MSIWGTVIPSVPTLFLMQKLEERCLLFGRPTSWLFAIGNLAFPLSLGVLAFLAKGHSDLKKIVIAITPSVYGLIPPTELSTQERANWIEEAAADLLDKSKYLRGRKDELGKTKNFAHPGLRKVIIIFIYIGSYRIAHRRPDIFCKQVPLKCLALVATAFNCILDGLRKNGNGKTYPNFSSKDYLSIYKRMLALLEDIMNNPYHGLKLVQQLGQWAEAGW
ncbi:hypothetical protein DFJ58DRAFT_728877 [Suillus subalutaceus]|uniref:uncharacterized protein n=1 Tax=Suillus subalutaceus TaxID=48586 RepID=UPI001B8671A4|nr:uncharacterized protein DFJ58DRAFT_728877 [Suillus subalutaceus]KAG1851434.1 hypothetical protein DFJ58DRAFT_728877 [Suillus subalutaceus]